MNTIKLKQLISELNNSAKMSIIKMLQARNLKEIEFGTIPVGLDLDEDELEELEDQMCELQPIEVMAYDKDGVYVVVLSKIVLEEKEDGIDIYPYAEDPEYGNTYEGEHVELRTESYLGIMKYLELFLGE